jgi:teichuronic acid biosynthesis glycosyltransferase TuaC
MNGSASRISDSPSLEQPGARSTLRILSLCCLYPNPRAVSQGLFVHRRLQHLAELADVMVVAPIAVVQYAGSTGKALRIRRRTCSFRRQEGSVTVLHPRWFYPPLSGSLTALWLFLRLAPALARIRKEFPFDVIDTHFGHPEGVAGALLSSLMHVPFTMTLRGNEPKHSRGLLGRFCMSWALRRASGVFAVSGRLRDFAVELGAAPGKVKIIPNGMDSAVFFPRDRIACRLKHGFKTDQPLIVSAGALVERKGHHRIIDAVTAISARGKTPQLAIVGGFGPEGAFESKLRELVSARRLESSVRFLGQVAPEVLAELLSAADVSCLASTNEGWPNVVHEALACGTPVVATDVGAVPEMLAGKYGVVVPVNDPVALACGLEKALEMHWDRDAIAAWGQARGWRQVATEVLAEMQAIAG